MGGHQFVVDVEIHRSRIHGLGFRIRGGCDFPLEDKYSGIYITSVTDLSPADESRKIFPGDEIIKINGEKLAGKSHSEVVSILKSADSPVKLTLHKNKLKVNNLSCQLLTNSQQHRVYLDTHDGPSPQMSAEKINSNAVDKPHSNERWIIATIGFTALSLGLVSYFVYRGLRRN